MATLGYIEKKTPALLTIASLVIIFPMAIRTFTVLMELLNTFQIALLANFVIFLILTVAAFRLLAMKRWALYVISASEEGVGVYSLTQHPSEDEILYPVILPPLNLSGF